MALMKSEQFTRDMQKVNAFGVWKFLPGKDHAEWVHLPSFLPDNKEGLFLHLYSNQQAEQLSQKFKEVIERQQPAFFDSKIDKLSCKTVLVPRQENGEVIIEGTVTIELDVLKEITFEKVYAQKLNEVLQTIPVDLVVFDNRQRYLFITEHAVKDPHTREWLLGKDDFDYCQYRNRPFDLAAKRKKYFQQVFTTKQSVTFEEVLEVAGKKYNKTKSFHPVLNPAGEIEYVVGFGLDTTYIKESENIIQRQNLAIESAKDGIALLDANGNYYYLNDAHLKFFGYESQEELVGKSWKELYTESEIAKIEQEYFPLLMKEGKWHGETRGKNKKGEPVYQEITLTALPEGELLCICRDFSERKREKEELRKLAMVVENTSSLVVITDDKGRVEWVNQAFVRKTGYSLEEIKGKLSQRVLSGQNTSTATLDYFRHQVLTRQSLDCELLNYTKSGEPYWVKIQGHPFNDGTGQKYFYIQEDITYRKKIEEDIIIARDAAEASSRSKRRFLANMSHEIRTPMNAIIGLTEQLLKSTLTPEQKMFADTIQSASNNLLTVINDILDISKIEEGKLQIENIDMDLAEVLERATDVLRLKAEEKGIDLQLSVAENIHSKVIGDPYRLNQVLLNLIGNGIKFTNQGHVHIHTTLSDQLDDLQHIRIVIEDTGIGIDENNIEHLFQEFQQEDQSFVRKFGGTGLGLSISKNLVELMGGTICIESSKGVGTIVTLNIPFRVQEKKNREKLCAEKLPDGKVSGIKVLLAEDNKLNSLVASVIFKNVGIDALYATNGEEAIQLLKDHQVDIVLMDIQMPVMDGVTATQVIRKNMGISIPIIALTAHALREEKEIYLGSGMNDFLAKPYTEKELLSVLSKWINKK